MIWRSKPSSKAQEEGIQMELLASASEDTSEQLTEPVTALWSQIGSLSSNAQRSSFKLISVGRLRLGAGLPPSSAHRSPATRQGIQIGPARYILALKHLQREKTTLVIAAESIGRTVDTAAIRVTNLGSLVEVQALQIGNGHDRVIIGKRRNDSVAMGGAGTILSPQVS